MPYGPIWMAKRSFPKFPREKEEPLLDEPLNGFPEDKGPGFLSALWSGKLFGVVKFLLGVCALPCVYAASAGFLNELATLTRAEQGRFWAGVVTMVIVYLFVWEASFFYTRGQRLLEFVFAFLKPLVKVAPYVLPIYALIIFTAYLVFRHAIAGATDYFLFLLGVSQALHLIFSAKTMRAKKGDFLKGNYLFGFSLIFLINVALVAFMLSIVFEQFSFVNFCNHSYQIVREIYEAIVKQLFL